MVEYEGDDRTVADRTILHVEIDVFLPAVEQRDRPSCAEAP